MAFELVETSANYQKDFSKVKLDRNMKDYEMLMQWSRVFLLNKSFTTFSGSTVSRALLFPMESVYESYVAQKMKKIKVSHDFYQDIIASARYIGKRYRYSKIHAQYIAELALEIFDKTKRYNIFRTSRYEW